MANRVFSCFLLFFCALPTWGCKGGDDSPKAPRPLSVVISGIEGIPAGVIFDRVRAEISGFEWSVIATVEAPYAGRKATLTLPASFAAAELSKVTSDYTSHRGDPEKGIPPKRPDYTGFWPGTANDEEAKVAGLGDIYAYYGNRRVGRIYLTDWLGAGHTSVGCSYVGYHFADRDYALSGSFGSYLYSASFKRGWNIYVDKNTSGQSIPGAILCTTVVDGSAKFVWRFEPHAYQPANF